MGVLQHVLGSFKRRPRGEDRRRPGRLPAHGQVSLLWKNAFGKDRQVRADVVEMSEEGLSVMARRAAPAGREAAITNGRVILHGVVRHCARQGRECTMGIEIRSREELPADSPYWRLFHDDVKL